MRVDHAHQHAVGHPHSPFPFQPITSGRRAWSLCTHAQTKPRARCSAHAAQQAAAPESGTDTPRAPVQLKQDQWQQGRRTLYAQQADAASTQQPGRTTPELLAARAHRTQEMQVLTSRLHRCRTWQELQALFLQHRSRMNHIHLSALMVRLAQLMGKRSSENSSSSDSRGGSEGGAASRNGAPGPEDLSGSAGQSARQRPALQLRPFLAQLVPHIGMQLLTFGPRQLSNTMWALGKLKYTPGPAWVTEWCGCTARKLDTYTTQDLAMSAWGLAASGCVRPQYPTGAPLLMVEIARACARPDKLPQCKLQDMSNLMWALASTGMAPEPETLRALVQRTHELLQKGSKLQVSALASILAGAGDSDTRSDGSSGSSSMNGSNSGSSSGLSRAHEHALSPKESSIEGEENQPEASVGAQSASMPVQGSSDAIARYEAAVSAPAAMGLKQQELSNLAWGLAKLRYHPGERFLSLLFSCFTQSARIAYSTVSASNGSSSSSSSSSSRTAQLPAGESPQHYANMLWSMAQLRYCPPSAEMAACLQGLLAPGTLKMNQASAPTPPPQQPFPQTLSPEPLSPEPTSQSTSPARHESGSSGVSTSITSLSHEPTLQSAGPVYDESGSSGVSTSNSSLSHEPTLQPASPNRHESGSSGVSTSTASLSPEPTLQPAHRDSGSSGVNTSTTSLSNEPILQPASPTRLGSESGGISTSTTSTTGSGSSSMNISSTSNAVSTDSLTSSRSSNSNHSDSSSSSSSTTSGGSDFQDAGATRGRSNNGSSIDIQEAPVRTGNSSVEGPPSAASNSSNSKSANSSSSSSSTKTSSISRTYRANIADRRDWLQRHTSLRGVDVAHVLWALGVLRYKPSPSLARLLLLHTHVSLYSTASEQGIVDEHGRNSALTAAAAARDADRVQELLRRGGATATLAREGAEDGSAATAAARIAALEQRQRQPLQAVLSRMAESRPQAGLSVIELVWAMWGLQQLHGRGPYPASLSDSLAGAALALAPSYHQLDPPSLTYLARGLARLGAERCPPACSEALVSATIARLPYLNALSLSHIMGALACIRARPDPATWRQLCMRTGQLLAHTRTSQPGSFGLTPHARALASAAAAAAAANAKEGVPPRSADTFSLQYGSSSSRSRKLFAASMAGPRELVLLLWGLARTGGNQRVSMGMHWAYDAIHAACEAIPSLTMEQLRHLVWAVCRLHLNPWLPLGRWFQHCCLKRLEELSMQAAPPPPRGARSRHPPLRASVQQQRRIKRWLYVWWRQRLCWWGMRRELDAKQRKELQSHGASLAPSTPNNRQQRKAAREGRGAQVRGKVVARQHKTGQQFVARQRKTARQRKGKMRHELRRGVAPSKRDASQQGYPIPVGERSTEAGEGAAVLEQGSARL